MTQSLPQLFASGLFLCLVQFLACLPWLSVLVRVPGFALTSWSSLKSFLPKVLGGLVLAAAGSAFAMSFEQDRELLTTAGRVYGAVLYLQLVLDFFVVVFAILLFVWPKGGAVAVAAFREGVRQPMYWLLTSFGLLLMFVSLFFPYFTFGEDLKMVKELGNDIIMLFALLFCVLAASMSISEEIEGRTAITLMSKPVSRRQFLLGKFFGILMAALLMSGILSMAYLIALWYKPIYDKENPVPPLGAISYVVTWEGVFGTSATTILSGASWWFADSFVASPGLILGCCQVMVLLAIAVALATRLPMMVNLVICLVVFFLGHLTPILAQVSQTRYALVRFMAQLFNILLPGLDLFNVGGALTRDVLPEPTGFAIYVGSVAGYAVLYTIIALLFGLILFEDRDLA
jgi:ABC-type transport system involved in multi-copper enzyme maturation permease subunit